jgi:hypothetical protein
MNLLMNFLKHFLMHLLMHLLMILLMILLIILLNPERTAGVSRDQVRYTGNRSLEGGSVREGAIVG